MEESNQNNPSTEQGRNPRSRVRRNRQTRHGGRSGNRSGSMSSSARMDSEAGRDEQMERPRTNPVEQAQPNTDQGRPTISAGLKRNRRRRRNRRRQNPASANGNDPRPGNDPAEQDRPNVDQGGTTNSARRRRTRRRHDLTIANGNDPRPGNDSVEQARPSINQGRTTRSSGRRRNRRRPPRRQNPASADRNGLPNAVPNRGRRDSTRSVGQAPHARGMYHGRTDQGGRRRPGERGTRGLPVRQIEVRPRIGTRNEQRQEPMWRTNKNAFRDFFLEGSVGHHIFPKIRDYLSIQDLLSCCKAGSFMHRLDMCRCYTVQELLSEGGYSITRDLRIRIGRTVLKSVMTYSTAPRLRLKRCMVDPQSRTYFWANLYHPREVSQIHVIIKRHTPPQETTNLLSAASYFAPDGSFSKFFAEGGIGNAVFPIVRNYLNVRDLSAFNESGLDPKQEMCGFCTISDFLESRNITLRIVDRIQLGIAIAGEVVTFKGGSRGSHSRPHRVISGMGDRWGRDSLYHPEESPEVARVVYRLLVRPTEQLQSMPMEPNKETLLSATFGERARFVDVTLRLASLACANGGEVRLAPPGVVLDARGSRSLQPKTFQHWYVRLFGDPSPRTAKFLVITTRTGNGEELVRRVGENECIRFTLSV